MENETSRPTRYNKGRQNTTNFDNTIKHINNIDSDGCGPPENLEKIFGPPQSEHRQ
jgi:hypothetical protein